MPDNKIICKNVVQSTFFFERKLQKILNLLGKEGFGTPTSQKKYFADCLKRNYLSGPALVSVEKEDKYEKIWERLVSSYGNTRLLLHNKLGTLEKISLSSVKGDQMVCVVLASLINIMQDLSTLAAEHEIEGQLYEGGGREKVLFLIGEGRHRKFRSQNLGPTYSTKQEWQKLKKLT